MKVTFLINKNILKYIRDSLRLNFLQSKHLYLQITFRLPKPELTLSSVLKLQIFSMCLCANRVISALEGEARARTLGPFSKEFLILQKNNTKLNVFPNRREKISFGLKIKRISIQTQATAKKPAPFYSSAAP